MPGSWRRCQCLAGPGLSVIPSERRMFSMDGRAILFYKYRQFLLIK